METRINAQEARRSELYEEIRKVLNNASLDTVYIAIHLIRTMVGPSERGAAK